MSYCRWSSDNFKCDLYCYEDSGGGFTTHVASNRVLDDIPKVPHILKVTTEEYMEAHKLQSIFLDSAEHRPIGLPYDGKSFNDDDLQSFLERLLLLREVGYNFPDFVLSTVNDEIRELSINIKPKGE